MRHYRPNQQFSLFGDDGAPNVTFKEEPTPSHSHGGYETEAGTLLLATDCLICGKPLRTPESVELGVGPICADKYGIHSGGTGESNFMKLDEALEKAPAPLREAYERGDNPTNAISKALHSAGVAWENKDVGYQDYLESFVEIADASGFDRMGAAVRNRLADYMEPKYSIDDLRHGQLVKIHEGTGKKKGWKAGPNTIGKIVFLTESDQYSGMPKVGVLVEGKKHYISPALIEEVLDKEEREAHKEAVKGTVDDVDLHDTVVLSDGTEAIVGWMRGDRLGLHTSPFAERTWGNLKDVVEVKKFDGISEDDIVVGATVRLTDGSTHEVLRNQCRTGFCLAVEKQGGGRGFSFVDLGFVEEVVIDDEDSLTPTLPESEPEATVTEAELAAAAPVDVRMTDGSVRRVMKTGKKNGRFWIGLKKSAGRGFDFANLNEIAEILRVENVEKPAFQSRAEELKLDTRLFDHQVAGAKWLASLPGAVLADDMGLGKTATSVSAMNFPCVVVCPASLKSNWEREVMMWAPDGTTVSVVDKKKVEPADVVIINYEQVKGEVLVKLKQRQNTCIVIDEAHFLKNLRVSERRGEISLKGSARAQNVWELIHEGGPGGGRISQAFLLTGTPMPNGRHEEFFPLLNMAAPDTPLFQNFYNYCGTFCPPEDIPGPTSAKSYKSNDNADLLRQLIEPIYLRRGKEYLDLPEKVRETVLLDLNREDLMEYKRAESEFLDWILSVGGRERLAAAERAEAIVRLTSLRKLAARFKTPQVAERIREYLDEDDSRPLVVMGHHKEALDYLDDFLSEQGKVVGRIDGQSGVTNRQKTVDAFQNGELDVVLCSVTAAGVGLTLTTADNLYFLERTWRPFDLRQAEDRIHRIGQKRTAFITYFDAAGTIDEHLAEVLDVKIANAYRVMEGKEATEEESDIASSLISRM